MKSTTAAPSENTPLLPAGNGASPIPVGGSQDRLRNASWFSRLTFQWFTPVLERGNEKKKLDQEDLGLVPLPDDCTTEAVAAVWDRHWKPSFGGAESSRQATAPPSSSLLLVATLARAFGGDFVRAGFLKLVHDLCVFVGPQVLHGMIVFLRSDSDRDWWHGLALTLTVTVSQLVMSLCLRHYFFLCYATGLRIRTAVTVAVYRKVLVLSSQERNKRTAGEITNLVSIDAQRLQGEYSSSLYCFSR
jgi:ATP-binding cassette, subfamily C (CFTR/MRP), member 1